MEEKNIFEWNVMIALFKATMEQSNFLTGQTQREAKMIFNRWKIQGDRLLKIIEEMSDEEYLEDITQIIENEIHKLRKNTVLFDEKEK